MIAASAAVLAATAAPVFAPPENSRYRYVVERSFEGRAPGRYRLHRLIRFLRDRGGIVAEVTLERVERIPAAAVPDSFVRGQGAFLGRTLRVRFAPDGTVRAIEGGDAVFAAMAAAIGPAAAAPLAALPAERRVAMLASIVDRIVAGDDAAALPGVRAVALDSALPGGAAVRLTGTRTVARDAAGRLVLTIHAEGQGARGERIVLDRVRTVDPAAGLVLGERETRAITVAGTTEISRAGLSLSRLVS